MATGHREQQGRRVPLWQSVQDQLKARINRGEFADGFPGEVALADEYEVSRSTIRSALAPLRRAGLRSAQRGRQSSVVNVVDEQRFGPVLPNSGTIVTYCQSGVRSSVVASTLRHAGYDVVELEGSYAAWAEQYAK